MKNKFTPFILFLVFACTSDVSLYYRIDDRYYSTIPQYQNGRSYRGENGDTLKFFLVSEDDSWVVSGMNLSNGKDIVLQDRTYYYRQENGTIEFRFSLMTYPNLSANTSAITVLEGSVPGSYFKLEFLNNDTLFFSPLKYAKELTIENETYREVYYNTDRFYYSSYGEIIRFKLNNSEWYTIITD